MANGHTVEPEVEAFFAPISAMLEAFAARHHLKIDRYVRGNPSWDFSFRLLDGGQAIIQVLFVGGDTVLVTGSREIRDYATFRRSTYRWPGETNATRRSESFLAIKVALARDREVTNRRTGARWA